MDKPIKELRQALQLIADIERKLAAMGEEHPVEIELRMLQLEIASATEKLNAANGSSQCLAILQFVVELAAILQTMNICRGFIPEINPLQMFIVWKPWMIKT